MWPSELHFHTNFQPVTRSRVFFVDGLAVKPARVKRRRRHGQPTPPTPKPAFRLHLVK